MIRPPPKSTLFPSTTLFRPLHALAVTTAQRLPAYPEIPSVAESGLPDYDVVAWHGRSEEHTSELQSHLNLVCRLLLEKKKKTTDKESEYLASLSSHTL